ncbi:glutamate-1-semialdehyde 2,1-aminomutase [bacterium]|nr:glutamate-1-semialdehyde 2,1-aminomutase [bacterium]
MIRPSSERLFERAGRVLVGGVDSPVRAFRSVGGTPAFIASGKGARMTDVDGNDYIDLVGGWGPLILGHAQPDVIAAVIDAAKSGLSFGACHEMEHRLGEEVVARIPSAEKVRFVNSGTEAAMAAIRLARGATGRAKIIKFAGCYHGHADAFLIAAGSGALTFGVPDSAGVPEGVARDTLTAPYNDLDEVKKLLAANRGHVAAIIVEPVAGNMGVVPPAEGFLEGLREVCVEHGALLVFDEVMTGFRVARGGAQERFGVRPDITVLGKIIGGGMPVGAYAASADLMDRVSPLGPVYQAGTLSGNPLAMAAGLATLTRLSPDVYEKLEHAGARLEAGLIEAANRNGVAATVNRVGSMITLFFCEGPVTDLASAKTSDAVRFGRVFHAMLDAGVYLPPSAYEAAFISAAHGDAEIDAIAKAAEGALAGG